MSTQYGSFGICPPRGPWGAGQQGGPFLRVLRVSERQSRQYTSLGLALVGKARRSGSPGAPQSAATALGQFPSESLPRMGLRGRLACL